MSMDNSTIDPRWGFSIVQDTPTNADTEQVPRYTSPVGRYMLLAVWKHL